MRAALRIDRIGGHEDLPKLRDALQGEFDLNEENREKEPVKAPLSEWESQLRTGNPLHLRRNDVSPLCFP